MLVWYQLLNIPTGLGIGYIKKKSIPAWLGYWVLLGNFCEGLTLVLGPRLMTLGWCEAGIYIYIPGIIETHIKLVLYVWKLSHPSLILVWSPRLIFE